MVRRRRSVFIETKEGRTKAPFTMSVGATFVDVSLRLREHGWTPYKVYLDIQGQAWVAVVIDWRHAA